MKKLFIGCMSLIVLGLGVTNVKADEKTEVEYEVGSDYVLSIPAKITLDSSGSQPLKINTVSHNISPQQIVSVKVTEGLTEDGTITLKRYLDTSTTIEAYVLLNNDALKVNHDKIGDFDYTAPQAGEISRLEIGLLGSTNTFKAGTYSTSMTFVSEIKEKTIQ